MALNNGSDIRFVTQRAHTREYAKIKPSLVPSGPPPTHLIRLLKTGLGPLLWPGQRGIALIPPVKGGDDKVVQSERARWLLLHSTLYTRTLRYTHTIHYRHADETEVTTTTATSSIMPSVKWRFGLAADSSSNTALTMPGLNSFEESP